MSQLEHPFSLTNDMITRYPVTNEGVDNAIADLNKLITQTQKSLSSRQHITGDQAASELTAALKSVTEINSIVGRLIGITFTYHDSVLIRAQKVDINHIRLATVAIAEYYSSDLFVVVNTLNTQRTRQAHGLTS